MKELLIDFDNKSPADLNKNINIAVTLEENDDVEYLPRINFISQ